MNQEHCTGVLTEAEACQQVSHGALQSPKEADVQIAGDEKAREAEPTNRDDVHTSSTHKSGSAAPASQLDLNFDAIKHIATCFLPGNYGKCADIRYLASGTFHIVTLLEFEDGWSCVGRFTIDKEEDLRALESEQATLHFVKHNSPIPTPAVYYVNTNPNHVAGAAFTLQERLPGERLSQMWDNLSVEHKKAAISQVADVVVHLSRLHFPIIGSLKANGEIGTLQNRTLIPKDGLYPSGPFDTLKDYMFSFLSPEHGQTDEVLDMYPKIKNILEPLLAEQVSNPILSPPWRLIHGDFDSQNMLFERDKSSGLPTLSGIIDWDNSYAGPAYYLYDYPIFIQDCDMERDKYEVNKILRKHFVQSIMDSFPEDSSSRTEAWECFRQKSNWLNGFQDTFTRIRWYADAERSIVRGYLSELVDGDGLAYGGRWDWKPDSEFGDDTHDEGSSQNSSDEDSGREEGADV
ncbi:hypothetical protein KC315_g10594 [Hortaea werneckii]|nr:hypothetical protein KC315_g10594 [Hortaea werneckii]